MATTTRISTSELLQHMEVPGHRDVFLLGCLERRVTVYSQQVRALDLIHSLEAEKRVTRGCSKVAIIGGGVAGLTAAAAAARIGLEVTVLEKAEHLLHIFRGCHKRWLHPRVYDWPAPGSLDDDADLPVLTWTAAPAHEVVEQMLDQWKAIEEAHGSSLRVHTSVEVDAPAPEDKGWSLTWRRGYNVEHFDVVILALGFGIERQLSPLPLDSYWHDDALDQSDLGADITYLISGLGDGGLTDLLRACIVDFRHDRIVRELGLDFTEAAEGPEQDALRTLIGQLEAIETEARTIEKRDGDAAAATYITRAYQHELRDAAAFVDARLTGRLRKRRVVLNGPGPYPLTRQASILNRFLASRLLFGATPSGDPIVDYLPGLITVDAEAAASSPVGSPGDTIRITAGGGPVRQVGKVIPRHGTDSALEASFQDIARRCKAELEPLSRLDQTRTRLWPDGWLAAASPASPARSSLTSPDGTPATTSSESPDEPPGGPAAAPGAATPASEMAPYSPDLPCFNVPYPSRKEYFTGRHGMLERTRAQLESGRRTAIGQAAAFQGLGGLGKTQLAVEYAHTYRDCYPEGVVWIEADRDIDSQLVLLAERAGWVSPLSEHKAKFDIALYRVRSRSDCLIIFDNLIDQADIAEYLPLDGVTPQILVTTRHEQPGFEPIELDLLDAEQSLEMLQREAGRTPDSDDERAAAEAIARRLDGLPLALEIAGAYLRRRGSVTWREYQVMLERNLTEALPARYRDVSSTRHEADLHATLQISEVLFAEEPRLRHILDVLACSGPAAMSLSLLATLLDEPDPAVLAGARSLGVALRLLIEEPSAAVDVEDRPIRIHRLVREVHRGAVELSDEWGRAVCGRLGAWFQERRVDFADLPLYEAQLAHLVAWHGHAMAREWPERVRLTWLQAYPPFHRGRYDEVLARVREALDLHAAVELDDPELEGHLRIDLAWALSTLGRYQEAKEEAEASLAIRREVLGEKHADTAASLDFLGTIHSELGRYHEALTLQQQALTIREEILGGEHREIATSLNNLGTIYGRLGEYQQSLDAFQKSHAIAEKVLSPEHPELGRSLGNLGVAHARVGEHGQARDLCQRALDIHNKVLGPQHPATAASLSNLGTAHARRGSYHLAIDCYEQALAIRKQILGAEHPSIAADSSNIGLAHDSLGDHELARDFYLKALAIQEKVLGPEHHGTARTLRNLGSAYLALDDLETALSHLEKAQGILQRSLGHEHKETINASYDVVDCLTEFERLHQARNLLSNHLRHISRDHPEYNIMKRRRDFIRPAGFRDTKPRGKRRKKGKGKRRK